MKKENDMFLNLMVNPTFTPADFESVGLNGDNTSLLSEEFYKNNERIKNSFTDRNGNFDEVKFKQFYDLAAGYYNTITYDNLTDSEINKRLFEQAQYSKDNIWVSEKQRTIDYSPKLTRQANERLVDSSLTRIGKRGPQTLSISEIAQTQKIWDTEKQEWTDAPNDSLWSRFFDTLVLAQYDEDEFDDNGNLIHQKGEYKLNDEGTYYYETLGGREVYGKQVLNKMNILTTDGSLANKFDFFDSDDINQKSGFGTLMKNAALVGTMFIPYLGPMVIGLSVASQTAGFLATLGKMVSEPLGLDSSVLNNIEGWSKSVNRQTAKTDYASEHTWCLENMLNMIGDTIGLLAEQRWIFKSAGSLIKGKDAYTVMGKGGAEKIQQKYMQNSFNKQVAQLAEENAASPKGALLLKYIDEAKTISQSKAQKYVDDLIKFNSKIGSPISKAYMTAITVQDTYGEAKAAGASDLEAAMLTLGYAAGEAAILNSALGEWIMPELHGNKFRYQSIVNALNKDIKEANSKLIKEASKEEKANFIHKLLNIGKGIANTTYANAKAGNVVLAHALGESFEEVSEELLADMSKTVFNTYRWLTGQDTLNMGQWEGMFDRYAMSALGGLIGGGITSVATDFSPAKALAQMQSGSAMQELLYIVNNGLEEEFLKTLDKMELGNKNLSANKTVRGTDYWQQAEGNDNQDYEAKQFIRNQVKMLRNMLDAEGALLSTDSLLNKLTLQERNDVMKDVRLWKLRDTQALASYAQDWQNVQSKLVGKLAEIKAIKDKYSDSLQNNMSDEDQLAINQKTAELTEIRKEKDKYLNGSIVPEAVRRAIFEMNPLLSNDFLPFNPVLYAKAKTGKTWEQLSDAEQKKYVDEFNTWKQTEMKDTLITRSDMYQDMIELFVPHADTIIQKTQDITNNQQQGLTDLQKNLSDILGYAKALDGDGDKESIMIQLQGFQSAEADMANSSLIIPFLSQSAKDTLLNMANTPTDVNYTVELREADISNFLKELALNLIDAEIQPILKQKYLHPEIKRILKKQLKDLYDYGYEDIANNFMIMNHIQDLDTQIDELDDTPILSYLDTFRLNVTNSDLNLTKHIENTFKLFNETEQEGSDLSDFATTKEWKDDNEEALRLIKAFKAVINGMRTDNADIDNPTGYTKILNDISRKVGVENYTPLTEMDSKLADLILRDVELIEKRLEYAQSLDAANRGQKLKMQDRVAANKNYLIFKQYQRFVNIVPDDWVASDGNGSAKQELTDLLDGLTNLKTFSDENKLKLTFQEKYDVEKEMALIDQKIYQIFQRNKKADGTFDVDKLADLIGSFAKDGGFFQKNGELLNEESKFIDDNAFIWHLAARAILNPIEFQKAYRKGFSEKIAPIPTLELATLLGVAAIMNGDALNSFVKAYKKSIVSAFNNMPEDEKKRMLEIYDDGTSNIFATDLLKYFAGHNVVPRYENMVFIEGAPGTGKSTGVFSSIISTIKNIDGGEDILKNAFYVHATQKSAEDANKNTGLNGTAMNKEKLMQYISSEWKDTANNKKKKLEDGKELADHPDVEFLYDDSYEFIDGLLVNKWKINKYTDAPKVMFIDEISHYNQQELSMIEQFAKLHGSIVITAGDIDQTKRTVYLNIPESNSSIDVSIDRNNFARTPKLGVMLRAKNKQIIDAIQQTKLAKDSIRNKQEAYLYYKYYQDDKLGLHGVKTVADLDTGLLETILSTIEVMKNTLENDEENPGQKQKIGYIYHNPDSEIKKAVEAKYGDIITFYKDSEAQGREGQYYIVENDITSQNRDINKYMEELYTGISRAKQGALVITPQTPFGFIKSFSSSQESTYEAEHLTDNEIKTYSEQRAQRLDQLFNDPDLQSGESITYTPPTIENILLSTNPNRPTPLQQALNNQPTLPPALPPVNPLQNPPTQPSNDFATIEALAKNFIQQVFKGKPSDYVAVKGADTFDITDITIDQIGSTNGYAVNIHLKDSAGNQVIEGLNNFQINYTVKEKSSGNPVPKYLVGDKITLTTGDIIITNIDSTKIPIEYTVTNLDGSNERIITETDLQSLFKNYYVEPTAPANDETVPDNGLENDPEQYQAAVTGLNLHHDPIIRTINPDGSINHIGYTFNMFESGGIKEGLNGEVVILDQNHPERTLYRIDGGIGIHKLKPNLSYKQVMQMIARLQNEALHNDSNQAIANTFVNLLGLSGNVKINFGIKSSANPSKLNNDGYGTHSSRPDTDHYYQYDFNEAEEIQHLILNKDLTADEKKKSLEARRKKVVIVVNQDGNNVLEIPLISFNNPLVYLQMMDPNDPNHLKYIYDDVSKTFFQEKQRALLDPNINDDTAIYLGLKKAYDQHKGNPKYKDITDLIRFYLITSNGFYYLPDDFNIAKASKNRGPELIHRKGDYQLDGQMQFTEEMIDIAKFTENPKLTVSSIFSSRTGIIENTRVKELLKGHQFVLVAPKKENLNTDAELVKQYEDLVTGRSKDQIVSLFYIIPPEASISDWIRNKHNLYLLHANLQVPVFDIGNDFTSYRIAAALIKSGKFDQFVSSDKEFKDDIIQAVETLNKISDKWDANNIQFEDNTFEGKKEKDLFEEYKSTYGEKIARKHLKELEQQALLNKSVGWTKGGSITKTDKLKDAFTNYITNIVYFKEVYGFLNDPALINQRLSDIEDACRGIMSKICYKGKYSTSTIGTFNKILVQLGKPYSLGLGFNGEELNYKINARIETPSFIFSGLSEHIAKFNSMFNDPVGTGPYKLNDFGKQHLTQYLTGKSQQQSQLPTRSQMIKSEYQKYFDNGELDGSILDDNKSYIDNLIALCDNYNSKFGNFGLIENGKLTLAKLNDDWKLTYVTSKRDKILEFECVTRTGDKIKGEIEVSHNLSTNTVNGFTLHLINLVDIKQEQAKFTEFELAKQELQAYIKNLRDTNPVDTRLGTLETQFTYLLNSNNIDEFETNLNNAKLTYGARVRLLAKLYLKNFSWAEDLDKVIMETESLNVTKGDMITDGVLEFEITNILNGQITLKNTLNGYVMTINENDLARYKKEKELCASITLNII